MTETITKEHAFTALCIWEAWLEDEKSNMGTPWTGFRSAVGAAEARQRCLTMAPTVDAVWEALSEEYRDGTCFDWEFVPMILDYFQWSSGPRLDGTPEAVAIMIMSRV